MSYDTEVITTLSGIILKKERERRGREVGPWQFYVNGFPVDHWTYKRTDEDFFVEDVSIRQSLLELPNKKPE